MSAIGLIETKGLVAAIEAADTMVKSADVRILEKHQVGGGLVTITVAGEVSAVIAAVDAAIAALRRLDGAMLISSHVIPRPYHDVLAIFLADNEEPQSTQGDTPKISQADEVSAVEVEQASPPATGEVVTEEKEPEQGQQRYTLSELQILSVSKLRILAEGVEGVSLSKQTIKTATKKKLIEAILNVSK
jgi:microcompartment protein CcmL/EutN